MAKQGRNAAFDDIAAAFADYGTSVRGYVRYQLTQRNLKPYLGRKQLRILDVGGGSGADAAWLVGKGHRVTFIEPSVEQRRYAERRFNFLLSSQERQRITIAGETIDEMPNDAQFDLILVHTVAMYQANPAAFLRRVVPFLKPGGLLSLMEKGFYGTQVRDIRGGDFADLDRVRKTQQSTNYLKQDVHAFKPEEIEQLLTDLQFEILEWSGIRLVTDDFVMPVERMRARQLKILVDIEYEHGHHPAVRGQGQLLHYIARKQ